MSGILAVVRTDGAPVDRVLVRTITESLRLRGPDAQQTWCDGQVGLGHALLRSTFEAAHEQQPLSLDGRVFIVADGRVDARGDLIRALGSEGAVAANAPDVELILRAYLRWGTQCVEHLLGDFAFAVWDGVNRRLFCARDHMGVKPFYYAQAGRSLLVSSTIEALRLHPGVSSELNDQAIADFLLVGINQDHATTSFHDIRRLPPAHTLTWPAHHGAEREGGADSGVLIKRYWTLPIEEPVYKKDRDYVDEFKSVVRQAVEDRLRVPRVGVFMSGGLDSPMLAATAKDILGEAGAPEPVRASTFVYGSLFQDPEGPHAKAIAKHLGIPIHLCEIDRQPGWFPEESAHLPEPTVALTDRGEELRCYQDLAQHSRVAFHGEGPDNALTYEWRAHLIGLVRARRLTRAATDIVKHVALHRRVPLVPTIPRMVRTFLAERQDQPEFPEWLEPGLVSRFDLISRWRGVSARPDATHPWRPRGYASLHSVQWQRLFERWEPEYTGAALEVRHPYVDIRVLRYLLRVPAMPWCRSKHLMRTALRGVLPEVSRTRVKTPLAGDPLGTRIRRFGLPQSRPSVTMQRYGNESRLRSTGAVRDAHEALQFVALTHWLEKETKQHEFKTAANAG